MPDPSLNADPLSLDEFRIGADGVLSMVVSEPESYITKLNSKIVSVIRKSGLTANKCSSSAAIALSEKFATGKNLILP